MTRSPLTLTLRVGCRLESRKTPLCQHLMLTAACVTESLSRSWHERFADLLRTGKLLHVVCTVYSTQLPSFSPYRCAACSATVDAAYVCRCPSSVVCVLGTGVCSTVQKRINRSWAGLAADSCRLGRNSILFGREVKIHTWDRALQRGTIPGTPCTMDSSSLGARRRLGERKCAENYNKWHFFLNCSQHFGNFKP